MINGGLWNEKTRDQDWINLSRVPDLLIVGSYVHGSLPSVAHYPKAWAKVRQKFGMNKLFPNFLRKFYVRPHKWG